MYRETYGAWGLLIFLIGAFFVLFSTVFVASASNARLLVDASALFGVMHYPGSDARTRAVRIASIVLPCVSAVVYLMFGSPVSLVLVGAIAQGLMLPFLAGAALYFHRHDNDPDVRRSIAWTIGLWLSSLAMAIVGLYQVLEQVTNAVAY
jgi:manganese transport protein